MPKIGEWSVCCLPLLLKWVVASFQFMSLVFENELYDMTETALPHLEEFSNGDAVFTEHPYGQSFRTDVVVVWLDRPALARRAGTLGHYDALPDERKYRRSYRRLQRAEPISRSEWIEEDTTYASDTARKTWDWLEEHNFLRELRDEEIARPATIKDGQDRLPGIDPPTESCFITAKFEDHMQTVSAFELKQRDWETALQQAQRAEHYSNAQYVVMDAGGVDAARENRQKFVDAEVGLLSLDRDGLTPHYRPTRMISPLKTRSRFMLGERALEECSDDVIRDTEERFA